MTSSKKENNKLLSELGESIGQVKTGLDNMSDSEKGMMLKKMNKRAKAWIYVKYCSDSELCQLLDEWEREGDGKGIKAMLKEIKRQRRPFRHRLMKRKNLNI